MTRFTKRVLLFPAGNAFPKALYAIAVVVLANDSLHAVDLDTIAQEGSQQAQAIATMQYEVSAPNLEFRCFLDGGKFRVEGWKKGGDRTTTPENIVAYNGARYYEMTRGNYILSHSSEAPRERMIPTTENPVAVMFGWIFSARRSWTWETACNTDAWREVLSRGKYCDESAVNGTVCYRVRLDSPRAQTDVFFAKDYRCYPMRCVTYSRETGKVVRESSVIRHKLVDTDKGKVLVPLETRVLFAGSPQVIERDWTSTIVESSLKINEPIDAELFTLVPSHTTMVVDVDKAKEERRKKEPAGAPDTVGASPARKWLAIANGVVVLIVAILLVWRAWTRRAAAKGT